MPVLYDQVEWPYLAGDEDVELTAEKDWAFRRAAWWCGGRAILYLKDKGILGTIRTSWLSHAQGTWRKTIAELHDMLKLAKKGISKMVVAPGVLAIRGGMIQKKNNKPQASIGKGKGYEKGKQAYAPKLKIPSPAKKDHPTKDSIYHHCE
nr:zinc finger, CCHC-type [Tanacetum cinerariifolium]